MPFRKCKQWPVVCVRSKWNLEVKGGKTFNCCIISVMYGKVQVEPNWSFNTFESNQHGPS